MRDAGFTQTEILILRRLIEEHSLSLRQLASKTGKSTGVLDQAMKKLLRRNVVTRDVVNDSPVYTLVSLEAIAHAIEEDVEEKRAQLQRRFENFESFLQSVTLNKGRPDTENFEGIEGLKRAYCKLLNEGHELIGYLPAQLRPDPDPLADFRVEFFRERRRREIFSRIIAHNTPQGRRFQSRDPFEYRMTLLVKEEECPFSFEKYIIGNAVACINYAEQRASIVRYPELAQTERALFESLWNEKASHTVVDEKTGENVTPVSAVPWTTRTLSQLREFFLGPKSLLAFAALAVLSGGITYALYRQNVRLNTERIRERVQAIAATAAPQFDWRELEQLRTIDDISKPEYAKVIYQLNEVRRMNEHVQYVYIFRKTDDPQTLAFVADADSIDPLAAKDLNGDNVIDDADALDYPGELYVIPENSFFAEGFIEPIADAEPVSDKWGTFISGHAPIYDDHGNVVASIGVDMFAENIAILSRQTFSLVATFFGLFFLFVLIRLAAFNRSLASELMDVMNNKSILYSILTCFVVALMATSVLVWKNSAINTQRIREKAQSIAATAALQFSAEDIETLKTKNDWQRPEWAKVVEMLKDIRTGNDGIFFAYIVRRSPEDPNALEFVADSHSLNPFANTDADPSNDVDVDGNGVLDGVDVLQWPGQAYPVPNEDVWKAFDTPTATQDFYQDSWGKYITGYAPIRDRLGRTVGVIAIDIAPEELWQMNAQTFSPLLLFVIILVGALLFRNIRLTENLFITIFRALRTRKTLLIMAFVSMAIFWVVYGLYWYTLELRKEELSNRLMSIAATAATQFDPADLEQLHIAADMQTDAYQRVFNKLLDIRKQNPGVRYAYVLRPTEQEDVYMFVADADSNYYIPFVQDQNQDEVLDEEDEGVAPGVMYVPPIQFRELYKDAGFHPVTDGEFYTDQWGTFASGLAPISHKNGKGKWILAIDMDSNDIISKTKKAFLFPLVTSSLLSIVLIFLFFRFYKPSRKIK